MWGDLTDAIHSLRCCLMCHSLQLAARQLARQLTRRVMAPPRRTDTPCSKSRSCCRRRDTLPSTSLRVGAVLCCCGSRRSVNHRSRRSVNRRSRRCVGCVWMCGRGAGGADGGRQGAVLDQFRTEPVAAVPCVRQQCGGCSRTLPCFCCREGSLVSLFCRLYSTGRSVEDSRGAEHAAEYVHCAHACRPLVLNALFAFRAAFFHNSVAGGLRCMLHLVWPECNRVCDCRCSKR
jgi:hypothetical protein